MGSRRVASRALATSFTCVGPCWPVLVIVLHWPVIGLACWAALACLAVLSFVGLLALEGHCVVVVVAAVSLWRSSWSYW